MLTTLGAGRALTLLKGGVTGQDKYGNDTRAWLEVVVDGCAWWPSSTTEAEPVGGDTITDRFGVLFPDGTDVTGADRVRLPDAEGVWQVDGSPRQHVSPITGATGGLYAWLQRVTG